MLHDFTKFPHPYNADKSKIDLRSYALMAADYINTLAKEADVEHEKFVLNALLVVRSFTLNRAIIYRQVQIIELRLGRRIEAKRRGGNVPHDLFKDGDINLGRIDGSNVDAKLKVDHISGNLTLYGGYGMGKSNLVLNIVIQLILKGLHVVIFDLAKDFRDLLKVAGCSNGLVLNHNNDIFNPLEPVGSPEEHLQFLWEITQQDFSIRDETKEMLFILSYELYEKFGVKNGGVPPSLGDLREFIRANADKSSTTAADKKKIQTALRKLDYILSSFKAIANCRQGYSIDTLDKFNFVSYEIGDLSEDKRSWYMKLKARQYQHKGMIAKERHEAKRIIVVDEAKGIFGKSRIGTGTNFIKDMFTKSRSLGCFWVISDQFTTELADFVRASSCLITFQHTVPKDIREISVAMGCSEALKRTIPQLGRYKALLKIAEHPTPLKITTYKSQVDRHIDDAELEGLIKDKIARLNLQLPSKEIVKKVEIIDERKIISSATMPNKETQSVPTESAHPLDELERFVRFIVNNPRTKLTEIYRALGLSGRKGGVLKNKAIDNCLITEEVNHSNKKGRPTKELKVTKKGREYLGVLG